MGKKIKTLLQPLPEVDEKMVKDTLEDYIEKQVVKIAFDDNLNDREKEKAVVAVIEKYRKPVEGQYDHLAEEIRESIIKALKKSKVVFAFSIIADSLLISLPAIFAFLGFNSTALITFAIMGVLSSLTITEVGESKGIRVEGITRFVVIGSYMLTQVPYFAVLITNWMS